MPDSNKHPSLLQQDINYVCKKVFLVPGREKTWCLSLSSSFEVDQKRSQKMRKYRNELKRHFSRCQFHLKKLFFITDSVPISKSVCPEQAFSNELDRGLAKYKRLSSIRPKIIDEEKEF